MTPEEIAAAGGKKTISEFLEEAELLPDVWGRLHAYETDAGWHVMQDDPDGGRAVADCDTMEIAKFLVCAPKAIIHLNQIVKDTSARAEAAEVIAREQAERNLHNIDLCTQALQQRDAAIKRAEAAEAKLKLVDDYGYEQWLNGVSGTEFEAGSYDTFAEWLAE